MNEFHLANCSTDNAEPNSISLALTRLGNPVKTFCDGMNSSIRDVSKAQRGFGKALDRALPQQELPMEIDSMEEHTEHVNRAILMHLLREGEFDVVGKFLEDTNPNGVAADTSKEVAWREGLEARFTRMYKILSELKKSNLAPAITWANEHSKELEQKGSSLEFDLTKLHFLWLYRNTGEVEALKYAREHFHRFQTTHKPELCRLSCATIYAPNLPASPYPEMFDTNVAFEEVSVSFTRDFCSLLGFSAESPLYVAITAGAISLPSLIKYTRHARKQRTEWTTDQELAFETPLPTSMVYHPIFVCPVSKEQTTDRNPPMRLNCAHVVSRDSLHNMAKGNRYKCPYCPTEGQVSDAIKISF